MAKIFVCKTARIEDLGHGFIKSKDCPLAEEVLAEIGTPVSLEMLVLVEFEKLPIYGPPQSVSEGVPLGYW